MRWMLHAVPPLLLCCTNLNIQTVNYTMEMTVSTVPYLSGAELRRFLCFLCHFFFPHFGFLSLGIRAGMPLGSDFLEFFALNLKEVCHVYCYTSACNPTIYKIKEQYMKVFITATETLQPWNRMQSQDEKSNWTCNFSDITLFEPSSHDDDSTTTA